MTIDPATLAFANRLADEAGTVVRPFFRKQIAVIDKGATGPRPMYDPVTEADRGAEDAMRKLIHAERPTDGILGEERGHEAGTSGNTWILDPIDGTRPFITGRHTWGTLIALHDGTRPILGIIDQPVLRERFIGHDGKSEMITPEARTFKGSRASGVIISDLQSWPMKRSRNTGWSMMPRIGRVPSCSAIKVPQVWRPVIKGRVPSIGSRIQVLPLVPASWPRSSPRMPSVGRSAWISFRIASSAPRSASVTGSYIGRGPVAPLSITAICLRKKGRTTVPASSARRLAKASVAGSIVMESSYQGAALNPPPLRWKKRIHAEFLQFLTQRHRATEGVRAR